MTVTRAIELLKIEKQCIERNNGSNCDRNCIHCDLVQDSVELIKMYDFTIEKLKEQKR